MDKNSWKFVKYNPKNVIFGKVQLSSRPNLIKIQLFIILSYEDLTVARRRSCACRRHL